MPSKCRRWATGIVSARTIGMQLLVHAPVLTEAVRGAREALARLALGAQAQDALDGCLTVLRRATPAHAYNPQAELPLDMTCCALLQLRKLQPLRRAPGCTHASWRAPGNYPVRPCPALRRQPWNSPLWEAYPARTHQCPQPLRRTS